MNIILFRDLSLAEVERLRNQYTEHTILQTTNAQEVEAWIPKCHVIFGNVSPQMLDHAQSLRWVQIVSSGFEEYQDVAKKGCILTTAKGLHAQALAEHVLMGMLFFARNMSTFLKQQRTKTWDRKVLTPTTLFGQAVGLIGYGDIGREVARRCLAFGMRVDAVKLSPPFTKPTELSSLRDSAGIDDLLANSDHLVLGLPLTGRTRDILDRRRIELMKQGACFYNVARGGLLDESALISRLKARTLTGAVLDVFAREPLPSNSPFWDLDNCIVTPHVAGHHKGLPAAIYQLFQENLQRFLAGLPLKNVASPTRGY